MHAGISTESNNCCEMNMTKYIKGSLYQMMLAAAMSVVLCANGAINVDVGPNYDKRKAFPLLNGVGSITMNIVCGSRYELVDSRIEDMNGRSLWHRDTKSRYYLAGAYAPEEYVRVAGTIRPVCGSGVSVLYDFKLTSPAIDIRWESSVGDAAEEHFEDYCAVPLSLTAPASAQRHVILSPAADKAGFANQVMLRSSNSYVVRFWRKVGGVDTEVQEYSTLNVTGETRIRVEPLLNADFDVSIYASGAADDYAGTRVLDMVKAYVYRIEVVAVKFNHDVGSEFMDGINIRQNHSLPFDIANGEWTSAQGAVSPICYRAGQPVSVKAKFSAGTTLMTSAKIKAENLASSGGLFNSFPEREVVFRNGESDWVEFTMNGSVPSQVLICPAEYLKWTVTSVDGQPVPPETITNTGPHKVYVILDSPQPPWDNTAGSECNAWTNALEFACASASGASLMTNAAAKISEAIYGSNRFQYEFVRGKSKYTEYTENGESVVCLTKCIDRLNGRDGNGLYVNCTDCASFVVSFANLLGCELYSSRMGSVFTTNPYLAIGNTTWTPPQWGWCFSYHEVAWSGNCGNYDLVYDACLKYNGVDPPTNLTHVAISPVAVIFSDDDPNAPYVYRERLTPPTTSGYGSCLPITNTAIRRSVE